MPINRFNVKYLGTLSMHLITSIALYTIWNVTFLIHDHKYCVKIEKNIDSMHLMVMAHHYKKFTADRPVRIQPALNQLGGQSRDVLRYDTIVYIMFLLSSLRL